MKFCKIAFGTFFKIQPEKLADKNCEIHVDLKIFSTSFSRVFHQLSMIHDISTRFLPAPWMFGGNLVRISWKIGEKNLETNFFKIRNRNQFPRKSKFIFQAKVTNPYIYRMLKGFHRMFFFLTLIDIIKNIS